MARDNPAVTGGTDGIGRYVAESYAQRRDRVVVAGRNPEKGQAFLDPAGQHAAFRQADLGQLADNRAVSTG
jgi:NAD(P)-dependent dehydrogenase (short-subunit alcohol dehydrogenase family)